jgi:hypothetical protein
VDDDLTLVPGRAWDSDHLVTAARMSTLSTTSLSHNLGQVTSQSDSRTRYLQSDSDSDYSKWTWTIMTLT